jgi:enamine deaminase RidA (YjgF/YER057c/UK114 family)
MSHEHIQPAELFDAGKLGFTQVVASPPGRQIFVSGQTAWGLDHEVVGGDDLGAQAKSALANLGHALAAAGAGPKDVTQMRVYIVGLSPEDLPKVGSAVAAFFAGVEPPASTWVGVQALVDPRLRIEIEATAVVAG